MADQEEQETTNSTFPTGRIKRIMKLDNEINKINSEALFLISNSTELFVKFLAEKSSQVAIEKKRKTIKLEHIRVAVKRHQPTADFLLDSLPVPAPVESKTEQVKRKIDENRKDVPPPPKGSRRIDTFFKKDF
ncbi:chromatin accessibility complex protein 1 [Tanacetum coccineum]|uniref:Chromatin accessibility complex protein 1 n=1 Tax=Tanacetum coccineum TaxID=301880 RepID=A0ABQ4YE69_9ASTR